MKNKKKSRGIYALSGMIAHSIYVCLVLLLGSYIGYYTVIPFALFGAVMGIFSYRAIIKTEQKQSIIDAMTRDYREIMADHGTKH